MLKQATILVLAIWASAATSLADAQILPVPLQQTPPSLDNNSGGRDIRRGQSAIGQITQRQAIELAQQRFSGNILRISLVGEGDNRRYQIRMEDEGKIFTVYVDAATGRVSGGG